MFVTIMYRHLTVHKKYNDDDPTKLEGATLPPSLVPMSEAALMTEGSAQADNPGKFSADELSSRWGLL